MHRIGLVGGDVIIGLGYCYCHCYCYGSGQYHRFVSCVSKNRSGIQKSKQRNSRLIQSLLLARSLALHPVARHTLYGFCIKRLSEKPIVTLLTYFLPRLYEYCTVLAVSFSQVYNSSYTVGA